MGSVPLPAINDQTIQTTLVIIYSFIAIAIVIIISIINYIESLSSVGKLL